MLQREIGRKRLKRLERVMGFEPHSVAESALKLASRLPLRGPAPSCLPHEGSALPSKPSVVDSNLLNLCGTFGAGDGI